MLRGQHDDSDSPRTPKSRLGLLERTSNASLEDSATNLAEVISILLELLNLDRIDIFRILLFGFESRLKFSYLLFGGFLRQRLRCKQDEEEMLEKGLEWAR